MGQNEDKLDDTKTTKAMLLAIIPSMLLWILILAPFVLVYTKYIEPKEVSGNLTIPEWTVMPTVIILIGVLIAIWKYLTNILAVRLHK